eukprot:COSAG02_NODE_40863_length_400_cov_1.538206_1_plen_32_part_10
MVDWVPEIIRGRLDEPGEVVVLVAAAQVVALH